MSFQPAKVSLWSVTVRVVLCALLGAITLSVVPLLPVILPEIGKILSNASDNSLPHFLLLAVALNMFYTPWGAIGALAGAGIGWLTVRARRAQDQQKADE